jgi:hypothetical protein
LGVRIRHIVATEIDDFLVATNGGVIVLTTVLPKQALHEPGLGEFGRDVEDSIEKDLRNFPAFFGDCSGRMSPINAD